MMFQIKPCSTAHFVVGSYKRISVFAPIVVETPARSTNAETVVMNSSSLRRLRRSIALAVDKSWHERRGPNKKHFYKRRRGEAFLLRNSPTHYQIYECFAPTQLLIFLSPQGCLDLIPQDSEVVLEIHKQAGMSQKFFP